ncbi:hypothetical protein QPK87_36205 [Kamptonema cortianum]|nr:hypothetical protein [Kamptonema cortianum]
MNPPRASVTPGIFRLRWIICAVLDIAPELTDVHIAMAELYEAFDDKPKAIDSWQRVLELAPDPSSRIHTEALAKLDNVRKKLDEQGGVAQSGVPVAGGGLSVAQVSAQRDESAQFDERLTVSIDIVTRDRTRLIDPAKVKIQVYFYDLLSNNQVVSTKARVKATFQDATVDWADGVESMQVVYEVPAGTWQRELKDTGISRNLYGYIVRIYYDDNLEDVYADPTQLAQLFPAKQKLAP